MPGLANIELFLQTQDAGEPPAYTQKTLSRRQIQAESGENWRAYTPQVPR